MYAPHNHKSTSMADTTTEYNLFDKLIFIYLIALTSKQLWECSKDHGVEWNFVSNVSMIKWFKSEVCSVSIHSAVCFYHGIIKVENLLILNGWKENKDDKCVDINHFKSVFGSPSTAKKLESIYWVKIMENLRWLIVIWF